MSSMSCVQGDARRDETWELLLGPRKAALLLTDPPYCLLTRRRKSGDLRDKRQGVKIDQDPIHRFEDVRSYRKFTEEWLTKAAARTSGPLIIWTNFLGKQPIRTVAGGLGYHEAGEFTWAKRTTESEGNEQLLRVYETALVFAREPLPPLRPEEPQRVWCVAAGYDDDGEAQRHHGHPNHKPFSVLEPLVRQWSKPGDLIVDCFAGSGSIPAAALKLGRAAACSELESLWAQRVTERLSAR